MVVIGMEGHSKALEIGSTETETETLDRVEGLWIGEVVVAEIEIKGRREKIGMKTRTEVTEVDMGREKNTQSREVIGIGGIVLDYWN